MIDRVDDRLRSWVRSVVGEVEVSLNPPQRAREGAGVGLYLMQVMPRPAARGPKRPPLQLSLRYLVTAWSQEVEAAHRLLGELVFAALEEIDEIAIVAAPGYTDAASYDSLLEHCEKLRDRVAILDAPEVVTKIDALTQVATAEASESGGASEGGADERSAEDPIMNKT